MLFNRIHCNLYDYFAFIQIVSGLQRTKQYLLGIKLFKISGQTKVFWKINYDDDIKKYILNRKRCKK